MAGTYLVTLDRTKCGRTLHNDCDAICLWANDATAAKEAAASMYPGDGTVWTTDGTATLIAAASDWVGWTFRIVVGTVVDVTFVGTATDNTMDEIAAALVILLNATTPISNSSYNSSTNVLTVAAIADGLGDKKLYVTVTPPGADSGMPSFVGTVVDGGIAGAVLTVVLPADAAVIPSVPVQLKQVG